MKAERMLQTCTAGLLLGAFASAPCNAQDKPAPATGAGIVMSSDAAPPPRSPSSRLVPQAVKVADHLEPAIPRPEQEKAAAEKLAAFEKRTGRKPNIVLLLVADLGWGDPGAFGGEKLSFAPADARARARDDHGFIFQQFSHER